jgi:2,4-dienoyl-CoA reductase-like NADH-dependent reductase (Old Yellow Enzyme family)
MLLGGINRLETMQQAMADGFEFVAMGRALLREPDLVGRLQLGVARRGICIHCNRCMPTIYSGTRCPEWAADEAIPVGGRQALPEN